MSSVDATKPPASPPVALSNRSSKTHRATTKLGTTTRLETKESAEAKSLKAKSEAEAEAKVKAAKTEAETVVQMASETVAASTTSTVTG